MLEILAKGGGGGMGSGRARRLSLVWSRKGIGIVRLYGELGVNRRVGRITARWKIKLKQQKKEEECRRKRGCGRLVWVWYVKVVWWCGLAMFVGVVAVYQIAEV